MKTPSPLFTVPIPAKELAAYRKLIAPSADRIAEQHQSVDPKYIDYISLRQKDKAEKTYELLGHLTDEGDRIYRTGSNWIELRPTPFDTVKEARQFARDYYPQLEVQRD